VVSVNKKLQDAVIRHAIALNRYERDLVNRIIAFLNDDLEPRLVARLESRMSRIAQRGYDTGVHTTKTLTDMIEAIRQEVRLFSGESYSLVKRELKVLAVAEAKWQANALQSSFPVPMEVNLPAPAILRQIVTESTINGALLKDWFKSIGDGVVRKVTREVNLGMASGETVDQMVRRLIGTKAAGYSDGILEGTRREVGTMVRTAAAHTSQQAASQTARANADIIKGEEWVATLDTSTCPVCAELDGQVFDLDDGIQAPAHPNCRCRRVAVTKSWQELGFNLKELDAGTRASMDGQVAGSTTFASWLSTRSASDIAEVLGSKAAAKAYLSGEVELGDFSSAWGKPLSLKAAMAGK